MLKKTMAIVLCMLLLGMCSLAMAENVELLMAANPTTGYDWHYEVTDEAIVKLEAQFEMGAQVDEKGEMLVGVGGFYTFTLTGVAAGDALVTFEYMQLQDETTKVVSMAYSVHVDENLNVTITGAMVGV